MSVKVQNFGKKGAIHRAIALSPMALILEAGTSTADGGLQTACEGVWMAVWQGGERPPMMSARGNGSESTK
jgi:hypothetical protein